MIDSANHQVGTKMTNGMILIQSKCEKSFPFFLTHKNVWRTSKRLSFPYVFQQLKGSRASDKANNRTHIETHGIKKNVGYV